MGNLRSSKLLEVNTSNVVSVNSVAKSKDSSSGSMLSKLSVILTVIVAGIAATAVFAPHPFVRVLMLVDFFTPWRLLDSPTYEAYHDFIVGRLPVIPEQPIPELVAGEFTREDILRISKDFTFPVVVRGALKDSIGVKQWYNRTWWHENYGNEEVLCKTVSRNDEYPFCSIDDFFQYKDDGNPHYISSASSIFVRNPEMYGMVDSEYTQMMTPGEVNKKAVSYQIFMGWPGQGSPVHSAVGVNVFRQIAGRKKWYFMPADQFPYLKPSINTNGISSHTGTVQSLVGEKLGGDQTSSPYFNKLVRYTSTLEPGDAMINPPWFWHAIENIGDDMVIGCPSRYSDFAAAKKSSTFMTIMAMVGVKLRFGSVEAFVNGQRDNTLVNGRDFMERSIAENRMTKVGEIGKKPLSQSDAHVKAPHVTVSGSM